MEKKKRFLSLTIALAASLSLAACAGDGEGGGGEGGGGGGGASVNPEMFTIDGLTNDLKFDGDDVAFESQVEVNMWSVINEPDDVAMKALVSKFNNANLGEIKINMLQFSVDDYYNALETAWNNTPDSVPDLCLMHCEKIVSYAYKNYLYPMNEILSATHTEFDFSQIYENVDRANLIAHEETTYRYSIPLDVHTFLFSIRQDMIKKNGLGFEDNTRFYPKNRAEYQELMQKARQKANAGELWYRSVDKADYSKSTTVRPHEWKKFSASEAGTKFYPVFMPIQDVSGLSALYSNGGTLVNEAGNEITVGNSEGFKTFLKDSIDYYDAGYIRYPTVEETRTNQSMFGAGETLMFEQGPWWVGQQYRYLYNNEEMTTPTYQGHDTGISEEDAADPVYSKPMIAMNPAGWFASEAHADNDKVYGNGHSMAITKKVTSMTKAAAILKFAKWLCQEKTSGSYNLVEHCLTGHLPAWKNIYNDTKYQEQAANSLVLQGLGDPANMITMENLRYEETCVSAAAKTVDALFSNLMSDDPTKKTYEVALEEMAAVIQSVQTALDLKIEADS